MQRSTSGLSIPEMRSPRDAEALRFIGEGYEVAQYQLHKAIFPERVATVVSRFVIRAQRSKLVTVERQNGIGINRLRLTSRGRALLVDRGICHADELFVPKTPVSAKDLAHTLWINDLRVAIKRCVPSPEFALPAWALQRRLQPPPFAIPDILAIWQPREHRDALALAGEIDLGGEGLKILLPKLQRLSNLLKSWSEPSPGIILVFTRGFRRRDMIRQEVRGFNAQFIIEALPSGPASQSIAAFEMLVNETIRLALDSQKMCS